MRHALPAVLAAAVLALAATAEARRPHHREPKRVPGHVSLHVSRHDVVVGRRLLVHGRVRPRGVHRVKVVVRGRGGRTFGVATTADGAFRLRFDVEVPGAHRVTAYGLHDRRTRGSTSVSRRVTVYRAVSASYYGPGLYGGALACGGTLQPGTLGVANMSLPCGTKVRLRYRGRSVTVPVVDRGPYAAGRVYDLTAATKQRLGFPDLGVVLSSR
jgi:hypothetical protein